MKKNEYPVEGHRQIRQDVSGSHASIYIARAPGYDLNRLPVLINQDHDLDEPLQFTVMEIPPSSKNCVIPDFKTLGYYKIEMMDEKYSKEHVIFLTNVEEKLLVDIGNYARENVGR